MWFMVQELCKSPGMFLEVGGLSYKCKCDRMIIPVLLSGKHPRPATPGKAENSLLLIMVPACLSSLAVAL